MFIFSLHRRWLHHCPGPWARLGGHSMGIAGHRVAGDSCQVPAHLSGGRDRGRAGTAQSPGLTEPHTRHRRGWGQQGLTRPPSSVPARLCHPSHAIPVSAACVPTPMSPSLRRSVSPGAPRVQPAGVHILISQDLCPPCTHPMTVSFVAHNRVRPCPAVSVSPGVRVVPPPHSAPRPCRWFVPCPPVSVSSHVPVSPPCPCVPRRPALPTWPDYRSRRAPRRSGPAPAAAPPMRPRSAHAQRRCLSAPGLAQRRV